MDDTNIIKREWSIREYREGDEEQMLEFRGIVTGDSKDNQCWKWMYRDNPAGPAKVLLAEEKQKIVGQYAVMPVRLKIGNQTIR